MTLLRGRVRKAVKKELEDIVKVVDEIRQILLPLIDRVSVSDGLGYRQYQYIHITDAVKAVDAQPYSRSYAVSDTVDVADSVYQANKRASFTDQVYLSDWFFRVNRALKLTDAEVISSFFSYVKASAYALADTAKVEDYLTGKNIAVAATDQLKVADVLQYSKSLNTALLYDVLYPMYRLYKQASASDGVSVADALQYSKSLNTAMLYDVLYPLYRLFKQALAHDGVSVADALQYSKSLNTAMLYDVLYPMYRLFRQALLSDSVNVVESLSAKKISVAVRDSLSIADKFPAYTHSAALYAVPLYTVVSVNDKVAVSDSAVYTAKTVYVYISDYAAVTDLFTASKQ